MAFRSADWEQLDKLKFYTFGPSIFFAVRVVVYPPSLVKTRMQVQRQSTMYSGTLDAFRKIFKAEGVRGLYRGFWANAWGILGGNLYITAFEIARSRIRAASGKGLGEEPPWYTNFVAGGSASLASQVIIVPLDVVSQRLMMQGTDSAGVAVKTAKYDGMASAFKDIVAREGFRGLWKGYTMSLLTYAPNGAIWWGCYGQFTKVLMETWPELFGKEKSFEQVGQAASAFASGCISAVLSNPMDVLRTRVQLRSDLTTATVARELIREEGMAGLMKGASARVLAMAPTSVITISAYELVKRLSLKDEADVE